MQGTDKCSRAKEKQGVGEKGNSVCNEFKGPTMGREKIEFQPK